MTEQQLVVGNPMLHEFHIKDEKLTLEQRYRIIQAIYQLCLQDDERWHFFFEAEEGDIIRCSPEFSEIVAKQLDDAGFQYRFNNYWVEELNEVVNNPEYFADMFHLNSIYIINKALKVEKNLSVFIDRVIHSLYLNYNFSNGKFVEDESFAICDVLLGRRFFEGMRYQYLKNKDYVKDLEERLGKLSGNQT